MFQISKIIFLIGFIGALASVILILICELRYNKILKEVSIILLTSFMVMFSGGLIGGKYFKETSSNQANNAKQEVIQKELDSKNTANNKQSDNKPKDTQVTNTNTTQQVTNTNRTQEDGINNYPYEIGMTFLKTFYNLNASNLNKQYNEVLKNIGTTRFYGTRLGIYNTFMDRKQTTELIKINKTMFLTSGETIKLEDGTYKAFDMYFNLDYKENGKQVINQNGVLNIAQYRDGTYKIYGINFLKEGPIDENKLIALQKCIVNLQEKAFNLSEKYLSIRYCGNLDGKLNELKSITSQYGYDNTIKNVKNDYDKRIYVGMENLNLYNYEFNWDDKTDSPSLEVSVTSYLKRSDSAGKVTGDNSNVFVLFKDNSYVVDSGR